MIVSNPTLITFVIYISAMVLIGFMAYRSTNNLSDYILGGRSLGSVVTALSAGASDMSGWLLMGLPGAIYMSGLSESWIAIGLVTGAYLNTSTRRKPSSGSASTVTQRIGAKPSGSQKASRRPWVRHNRARQISISSSELAR